MDIGISYWFGYPAFPKERIRLIKEAGFSNVSLHWTNEYMSVTGDKFDVLKQLKSNGIEVSSFHLSFEKSYLLWDESWQGRRYRNEIREAINDAVEFGVKVIVMHSDGNFKNGARLEDLFSIMSYAKEIGVILCLENLQHEDNLRYICFNKDYTNIPICYDFGHNNIRKCPIDKEKMNIQFIHISDNDGKNDLHYLPYEGTIDWTHEIEVVRLYPDIPKILEVHEKLDNYSDAETFLHRAKILSNKLLSDE